MRDNPTGRFNSETTCGECGLIKGHRGLCRGELPDGELLVIDQNGESSDATKGSGQGGYKVVLRKQLKDGWAQQGRCTFARKSCRTVRRSDPPSTLFGDEIPVPREVSGGRNAGG